MATPPLPAHRRPPRLPLAPRDGRCGECGAPLAPGTGSCALCRRPVRFARPGNQAWVGFRRSLGGLLRSLGGAFVLAGLVAGGFRLSFGMAVAVLLVGLLVGGLLIRSWWWPVVCSLAWLGIPAGLVIWSVGLADAYQAGDEGAGAAGVAALYVASVAVYAVPVVAGVAAVGVGAERPTPGPGVGRSVQGPRPNPSSRSRRES